MRKGESTNPDLVCVSWWEGPPGPKPVSHDSPRAQMGTFQAPALQTTIPQEDTRERERMKMVAGEGKKSAKFLGSHPSEPHPSGPHTSGGRLFLGLGPTLWLHHDTHTPRSEWIGQNWFWPKLVKSGWPKRDWPKSVPSVWKRGGAQMRTFGVLGLSCEAPAALKPKSHDSTNLH